MILIDRGHGINTEGKGSPYALSGTHPMYYLKEWQYCDEIAARTVEELKRKGYPAMRLVTEKYDVPLSERCARANRQYLRDKNTFLVSIHVDAYGDGKRWTEPKGWSVWTTPGVTESDKLADYLVQEAAKTFSDRKIRYYSFQPLGRDFEANFKILTGTRCPAVLTENFFQTNVDDVKFLLSDEGKKKVIKCHVNGIINYINSLK